MVNVIVHGILKPKVNALLSRTRHTNKLVIADRGFPFCPHIETIDISLVDDIPKVSILNKCTKNRKKSADAI